ncbi:MAG: hypothetical protein RR350_05490 [Oscillibacter sp.]
MNRAFTQREKALLLCLTVILLVVGYFKLFAEPIQAGILNAREQSEIAAADLMVEQVRLTQQQTMQTELDALTAQGVEQTASLPVYDNVENVMLQLDTILSATKEYSLQFDPLVFGEDLISRPIHLTFVAQNYAAARAVLNDLYHCWYRCSLDALTLSSEKNIARDALVSVDVTLTFYEAYE